MLLSDFQKKLQFSAGKKLKLTINDNHSTMLSVKWGEPDDCIKVSLHRMFLSAPSNVMQALACHIHNEEKSIAPTIKAFIEDKIKTLDYSKRIDFCNLQQKGNIYNLKTIYDDLNNEYFDRNLKLNITWFGDPNRRNKSQISFGLYYDPLKLIKINRILDSLQFPEYLVSFIVYHEMLHHICPPYVDVKGVNRVHNKEFKARELEFRHYDRAQNWLKKHRASLFE